MLSQLGTAPAFKVLLISELFHSSEMHASVAELREDSLCSGKCSSGKELYHPEHQGFVACPEQKNGLQVLLCSCPSLPALNGAGEAQ